MIHFSRISLKAEFHKVEDSLCRMSYQIYQAGDHEGLPLTSCYVTRQNCNECQISHASGMVDEK